MTIEHEPLPWVYLEAVKFWLPKAQKSDIIDELSADIDAQVEEREASLGRALTEPEVELILKQRGRPVVVANRFLPQEQLIGPLLFPVYRFVLKIICLCYLLPWALAWVGMMTFDHAYRAQQTRVSWLAAVASAWSAWWTIAFVAIGLATLVFAILERAQAKSHFLDEWSPRKLPRVRIPYQITRTNSIFELAVSLLFFVWWALNASPRIISLGSTVRIELGPQWVWFFSAYLVLAATNAALAAANLLHPYWTIRRAALRLLSDCVGGVFFCWLLRAHIVTSFSASSLTAEKALQVTRAIDYWMAMAFPWAIVASVAVAAAGIYRIIRVNPQDRLRRKNRTITHKLHPRSDDSCLTG